MNIAIISPIDEKCGVCQYTTSLKEALLRLSDYNVLTIGYKNYQKALYEANKPIHDLIHIQYVPGLYPDKELLRRTIIDYPNPVVITAHHFDKFLESLQDNVDKIIVHDEIYKNEPKITYLVQGCPVFDEINNKKVLRKELAIPSYAKVICSFGFMMKWKRLDYVLQSFAPYLALNRDLFIILLHSYHEHDEEEGIRIEKELERIIYDYNISNQCIINHTFMSKDMINKYIQASDIGILFAFDKIGSHGSSAVMKEYISGRCPVIASDIPHYGDIEAGNVKVQSGDMISFIYNTLYFLYDSDELFFLREEQKENYEKYNYDEFAKKHIEIYNQLEVNRGVLVKPNLPLRCFGKAKPSAIEAIPS